MNREPNLDDLIGAGTTGAERQRLQHVHELLLEAGPPPELSPELEEGPNLKMTLAKRRRAKRQRAMLLLAAAIAIFFVFIGGYAIGNNKAGSKQSSTAHVVRQISLVGTSRVPRAEAALEVWRPHAGNWPMTLTVAGLPKLPAHRYYEVYLVRNGKPWGSCGTFRVAGSSKQVTVTLTAPYSLRKGDTWVVTQPGPGGSEPGTAVLEPVKA